MKSEEKAPAAERWREHLKDLRDPELTALAGDYCWILEKNRPEEGREDFRKRREAILAECERRGLKDAAKVCRPSSGSSSAA